LRVTPISYGYFRLTAIDGKSLPRAMRYLRARCTVLMGDARLSEQTIFDGDGTIAIALFGTTFGHPPIRQIFLERQPFDQLDHRHLTFPGGHRRWRRVVRPHCVVWLNEDDFLVRPIRPHGTGSGLGAIFGEHEWRFVRSSDLLPNSDVAGNTR